jgi:hypothetical protein
MGPGAHFTSDSILPRTWRLGHREVEVVYLATETPPF